MAPPVQADTPIHFWVQFSNTCNTTLKIFTFQVVISFCVSRQGQWNWIKNWQLYIYQDVLLTYNLTYSGLSVHVLTSFSQVWDPRRRWDFRSFQCKYVFNIHNIHSSGLYFNFWSFKIRTGSILETLSLAFQRVLLVDYIKLTVLKGAGSFHIHRKTMKELCTLAVLGVQEQPNLAQNLVTHRHW